MAGFTDGKKGGSIQGQDYVAKGAQAKVLPVPAGEHPVFRLAYHPRRWDFFVNEKGENGRWLPVLRRIALSPGTNNIDKDGSTTTAYVILREAGWEIIEPETVLVEGCKSYITVFPAIGGDAHYPCWTRIKMLGGKPVFKVDEAGYQDWLAEVTEELRLELDPDVKEMIIARIEAEYAADLADSAGNLKAKLRAEAQGKRLEAMRGNVPSKAEKSKAGAK